MNDGLFEGLEIVPVSQLEDLKNKGEEAPGATEDPKGPEANKEDTKPEGYVEITPVKRDAAPENTPTEGTPPVEGAKPPEEGEGAKNKYSVFAKELAEMGALGEFEEGEIKSADDLKELVEKTLEEKKKKFESSYGDKFSGAKKKFLEIESSFDDESVAINVAKDLAFYEDITDDKLKDEKVAEQVYTKYLKATGLTDDQITEMVDDAKLLDKLTDKAKSSVEPLKTMTNAFVKQQADAKKLAEEKFENSQKEIVQKITTMIDEKDHFIEGLALNKVTRDKIKSSMSETVHVGEDGRKFTEIAYKQNKNPEGFATLINYLNVLGVFKQDKNGDFTPDISKLMKVSKSKASSELDSLLNSSDSAEGFKPNESKTVEDKLSNLSKIFGAK